MNILTVLALCVAAATAGRLADLQSRSPRIVGGDPVPIEEVPWMAAVVTPQFDGNFGIRCGGSVISSFHVLSAAHCFPFANWGVLPNVQIRVGSHHVNFGGTLVGVENVINHPNYDWLTEDFDITVIFLQSPVFIGSTVQTLSLPHPLSQLTDGQILTVAGWGRTQYGGDVSEVVLRIDVPVINWDLCRARYIYLGTINPEWAGVDLTLNQFCAGLLDVGGQDACQGTQEVQQWLTVWPLGSFPGASNALTLTGQESTPWCPRPRTG